MWVLGIAASHNSAVALVRDGRVVCAVQTERLTRVKRHPVDLARMPREFAEVIRYVLRAGGADLPDLAAVAVCSPAGHHAAFDVDGPPPSLPPFVSVPHHLAHAEYAVHYAPDGPSLVLVCDGSGTAEDTRAAHDVAELTRDPVVHGRPGGKESISAYAYDGRDLRLVHRIAHGPADPQPPGPSHRSVPGPMLDSIGHLWEWAADYCHGGTDQAGKVMGLAPYGDPAVYADLDTARLTPDGDLRLDLGPLFRRCTRPNTAGADVTGIAHYAHVAAHVQSVTDGFLRELLAHLLRRHPAPAVAYSGGVALNGITNQHLIDRLGVTLHMNGSCEDNGTAIGAALAVSHRLTGRRVTEPVRDDHGRRYRPDECAAAVAAAGCPAEEVGDDELARRTAALLAGGAVVAWFQGRGEFGPRALGRRSILADPRRPDMKDHLNRRVKNREAFRPFAPVVREEDAGRWFGLDGPSPMMLRMVPVRSAAIPAVTHVDGSARVQTVTAAQDGRLHALLTAFDDLTGVPVLLNTSFNVAGEPIVESPRDAVRTFLASGVDVLVLGNLLVRRGPRTAGSEQAVDTGRVDAEPVLQHVPHGGR